MGAVDLVIQVESPGAVAAGLQRIGRAGHQVGEPSRGKIFPKHRGDLVEAAVVAERMHDGPDRAHPLPAQPARRAGPADRRHVRARRVGGRRAGRARCGAPRRSPSWPTTCWPAVLDLLAGRYPSDEFAELRPRIVWDRVDGTVRGRAGAQRLAVTSGGTIPDRGLFGVFLPDGTRVGELDEEMVYESRPGETFLLGASTWRIEDITHDRVIVTPAPGRAGQDAVLARRRPGPPARARPGARRVRRASCAARADDAALERLQARRRPRRAGGDEPRRVPRRAGRGDRRRARRPHRSWSSGSATRSATGACACSRRSARRCTRRGPWRSRPGCASGGASSVELHVERRRHRHAPARGGRRAPGRGAADRPRRDRRARGRAAAAARRCSRAAFRECAARALLLPRRRPDRRTPLWQQRQRAADLLAVAAKLPDFPILLEATRECLNDVFDLPALREVLRDLRSRRVRVVAGRHRSRPRRSPSRCSSGGSPSTCTRATRRWPSGGPPRWPSTATCCASCSAPRSCASCSIPGCSPTSSSSCSASADEPSGPRRRRGRTTCCACSARSSRRGARRARREPATPPATWVEPLRRRAPGDRRSASPARSASPRPRTPPGCRDALGVALPLGLPGAFTDPVDAPLDDLVARYARTHGPFLAGEVAAPARRRPSTACGRSLDALEADGRVVRGEFRPGGVEREWCDDDVLRQLRRRSLAALRARGRAGRRDGARPVPARVAGRRRRPRGGVDALVEAVGPLQGAAVPASVLETDVLPARVGGYRPADLDALVHGRRGGVGRRRSARRRRRPGRGCCSATRPALLAAPRRLAERPARRRRCTTRSATHLARRGARRSGPSSCSAPPARRPTTTDGARRALGPGVGRRGHQRLARAAAGVRRAARRASARARHAAGRRPRPGRAHAGSVRRPAPGAGRSSRPLLEPAPAATEARPRPRPAAARALRRAHPRGRAGRGRRGRVRRRLPGAQGDGGAGPRAPRLLRGRPRRRPVRAPGRRRPAPRVPAPLPSTDDPAEEPSPLVLAATDPAQPYGAALPWPERGRPARRRGASSCSSTARRWPTSSAAAGACHVRRGPGRVARRARLAGEGRAAAGGIELGRIDGTGPSTHPAAADLRAAGFADGYRGLTLRG